MRDVLSTTLIALIFLFLTWPAAADQIKKYGVAKIGQTPSALDFYPDSAMTEGREGQAVVKVCVDGNTQIESAAVVSSSGHEDLDAAAISLARASQYQPEKVGDVTISSCVSFRVKFEIAYSLPAGAKFDGETQNGLPHGQGTLTFSDGTTYVGEFLSGLRSGQGKITAPDGSTYVGEWKDDALHGRGISTTSDGVSIEGEFRGGLVNGQGRLTAPDGTTYVGQFKDGKFHGAGDLKLKAKISLFKKPPARYVGHFREGLMHGFGTLYSTSGAILQQGVWERGRLVSRKTEKLFLLDEENSTLSKKLVSGRESLSTSLAKIDSELTEISAAEERYRIEKYGDGSADDLACKARKLKPSTTPYLNCRRSLLAAQEARKEQDRLLAEKRARENVERERRERIAVERERERQEERKRRREAAAAKDPFFYVKEQCRELGFKDKTERFGECVLELSRRGGAMNVSSNQSATKGDGSADDQTCTGYGYRVGTTAYSDCRLQLDMARRDYEREMRAYEAEKAAYERRVAEAQAEQRRQQQQRQAQYGFCVAQCSSQPGATTLGCMSRCGAAAAGLSYDPGAPPTRPSGRTTYVINGQIINCRTSPSGSVVTCN